MKKENILDNIDIGCTGVVVDFRKKCSNGHITKRIGEKITQKLNGRDLFTETGMVKKIRNNILTFLFGIFSAIILRSIYPFIAFLIISVVKTIYSWIQFSPIVSIYAWSKLAADESEEADPDSFCDNMIKNIKRLPDNIVKKDIAQTICDEAYNYACEISREKISKYNNSEIQINSYDVKNKILNITVDGMQEMIPECEIAKEPYERNQISVLDFGCILRLESGILNAG